MKKSLYIAATLLALVACAREMNVDTSIGNISITARTETSAETKTIVEGQTHVYWERGDEIKVFAGGKSGEFTTDITASVASATFKGTLGGDAWTEGMNLWAVYPYSQDAFFSGETITTVLPAQQVARAGSFGKGMNLAVAHSTASELQFYNVGGGVRFSLSQDGITEVVLEGLKGETLAGKVKIGFNDGKPVIREVTDGKTSITVTPPNGEAFKKNVWYYIVVIPGVLENGFTFRFKKESDPSVILSSVYPKTVSIKRGIYGVLTHVDQTVPEMVIPVGYELEWNDEFDADGMPSATDWWYETGGGGWGNNEEQVYVAGSKDGENLAIISDGTLKILAKKIGTTVYSIRMNTSRSWQYGWFEARIKVSDVKGSCPALWMMPKNFKTWPGDGEIDILEYAVGTQGKDKVSSSIHTNAYNWIMNTQKTHLQSVPGAATEFHVYALEWTASEMVFYIDGNRHLTFKNDGKGYDTWPFDAPFYLKFNLAWGGYMGGATDTNGLPATYEVDYVRVFKKK